MRIDKIHIKNFKCFEDSTFELNPHFTVIIGDNGKGKTAVCDALAAVLGRVILGNSVMMEVLYNLGVVELHSGFVSRAEQLERLPSRKDFRTIKIDGQPKPQMPLSLTVRGQIDSISYNWGIEMEGGETVSGEIYGITSKVTINQKVRDAFTNKIKESRQKSGVIFPLVAYYGTDRTKKHLNSIPYQKQEEGIMHAYPDCLFPDANVVKFLSWYKTQHDEILKFNRERDKILLKVINEAIMSMIPEWTEMEFSFREDDIVGNLDGEERLFGQLSDGYRITISMVGDMIYRCIQLNPHFGENVLKETPGVVLIDELDLHLHPNWQRRIVADLKRIFPKVQFVATTHSPFIVQSLRTEELINLDTSVEGLEDDPLKYSLEEVADSEMGIEQKRSEKFLEMQAEAAAFFQLIKNKADKTDIAKAKAKLDELRILFNHDPAYVALLESELPKD